MENISSLFETLLRKFPEFMSILTALLIAFGANIAETASTVYKGQRIDFRKKIAEMIVVASIVSLIYYIDTQTKIPFVPIVYYFAGAFGVRLYDGIKEAGFSAFLGTIKTLIFGILRYIPEDKQEKKEGKNDDEIK